jgi:cytochrome b
MILGLVIVFISAFIYELRFEYQGFVAGMFCGRKYRKK